MAQEHTSKEPEEARGSSLSEKEVGEAVETLPTFYIPRQIEELDFKKFLGRPLFGAYIRVDFRSMSGKMTAYQEKEREHQLIFDALVCDSAVPFSGVEGRAFREMLVGEGIKEKIVPMSLNEWCYLFTQLTEKQLLGDTYYLVRFDDGITRYVMASVSNTIEQYTYSLRISKPSRKDSSYSSHSWPERIKPRIIVPV